jgi:hypothetical protein
MSRESKIEKPEGDASNYLEILSRQYTECCADIRNFDTMIWQTPALLTAVMSLLGILYGYYLRDSQSGRFLALFLALGFTSVSLVAIIKHRFFANKRVKHLRYVDSEFKWLLEKSSFAERFRKVKRTTSELLEGDCCIYNVRAYHWQLGLVSAILLGILAMLLFEFIRFASLHA